MTSPNKNVAPEVQDEGYDGRNQKCAEYHMKLRLLVTPQPNTGSNHTDEGESASAICSFSQLLPAGVDRSRRSLTREYLEREKQEGFRSRKKNLQVQLKAKKRRLKFLDAIFIRNSLFSHAVHPQSEVSSLSQAGDNDVGSKTENDELSNSCKEGGDTSRPKTQENLPPSISDITKVKPTTGPWFWYLKSNIMNQKDPTHLFRVAYGTIEPKDSELLKKAKSERRAARASRWASRGAGQVGHDDSSIPSSSLVNSSSANTLPDVVPEAKQDTITANPASESEAQEKQSTPSAVEPELTPPTPVDDGKASKEASSVSEKLNESDDCIIIEVKDTSTLTDAASAPKQNAVPRQPTTTSTKAVVDTVKGVTSISSNSSELSVKSVISENTDSSSSTSTSISSSSVNESVSIVRPLNAPITITRGVTSNSINASTSNGLPPVGNHGNTRLIRRLAISSPKPPKKYSEKMKAEASVLQRITELQKEGMWWEKRLPKCYEPPRAKAHWDYLLEEMTWMASDFMHERKWKRNAAKKCARMIEKYFHEKEQKRLKAEKDEEIRKRKTAGTIAKLVRQFWSNVQKVVEFKEQSIIESMRKKALDQKLSYLVNETEKYSEIVAQTFTAIAKKTGIETPDAENSQASDEMSTVSTLPTTEAASSYVTGEALTPPPTTDEDMEFVPPSDSESDVDDTIAEEEAKERSERLDHENELEDLEAENNMSMDEILAKYASFIQNPEAYKEPESEPPPAPKAKPQETRITRGRSSSGRPLRGTRRQEPVKVIESDVETEVDDSSSTEEESQDEDAASETEKTNDLASLLKSISSDGAQKNSTEEETNKLADLAESFQPKGYTLSSTKVVTKVPFLIRHTLREYQHIGLDWLVTMYDKRLNGILADEMGLGKTIQTIALIAYLAVERGNWGPHLIIVPTSVMLNWEMEFKKWCPGLKILTYYGSQKERKLKRSGWTKPNAFHVCITSYKLVIQDHQSFRRKRWKYLILDEAQNIKNFKSQRWQLLLNFNTQRRLLLTGTPLQNNLMELWSLLHFLMPNVFQSHMEFKDWFSNPMSGMVEGSQEYNEDIVRRLHKVLRPFILRRMKSEVEKQLPQKYEHVVMCSLSKRQRYLYEEFMSRTKTKDTLNQGNLLSVINVLMQLRKVCNHPNLFEPRPIVSPFQTEGIQYNVPSLIWDVLRELMEDSFHQQFPLFTLSNSNTTYGEYEAQRIMELTPLFAYNPDEERRYVVMNYEQCRDTAQPPEKRIKRIVNLVKNEPPSCPILQKPLTYFMSTNGKPDEVLADRDFVDYLRLEASSKQLAPNTSASSESEASQANKRSPVKPMVIDFTDQDESCSDGNEDFDVDVRKRKVPLPPTPPNKLDLKTRIKKMGATVPDFKLNFIQDRRLHDRKLVVDNLNKVNWTRCRVNTFFNRQLVKNCEVVGSVPSLRLNRRVDNRPVAVQLPQDESRDYNKNGYFHLGYNDVMMLVNKRREGQDLLVHPLLMWSITSHLDNLVQTPGGRLIELKDILKRYVMYIPAVSAPTLEGKMYRPSSSHRYLSHARQMDEYRNCFSQPTDIVHPIVSTMLTQFPDPRLIQYDCGKLQTLDTLLRRLKSGSHRVLIFTQMAKVLDILEAFLNYHGHTYLRLDGATKIDQRQLLMERFNADKKIFCFILSTRSGGIGVNLTGADTVIFYDSDWNPTMDAQAQDRCHRIGQTRDVHIYRLVSEKTVEENILKKSNQKRLLGELAIEGGKFTTTYFKQHTIRELFTINEKDDVEKRLNSWNSEPVSNSKQQNAGDDEDSSSINPVDLIRSPEKQRNRMHVIECALAAAEDDTDVQAAQTAHAEAEAEMAEFDESVSLDALDDGKNGPNKFEVEFQQVFDQLTDIERYALKLMESTIDDWSKETVAQAQKDLEEQKLAWEQQQQRAAMESGQTELDEDSCATEDIITYSSTIDPINQVWVAKFGNFEQELLFPVYQPPTPPHDDMDVYFDSALGYLYDYDILGEAQLPPIYVAKHPKKQPITAICAVKTPEKMPDPPKEISPEVMDIDSDSSPTKKSPKVGRREDPIFAPKSLFDRPTPALAKIRRDLRLQRYSQRPASNAPKTLGPGSITFPIVPPGAQKQPPPPTASDAPDWMYAEDYNLLQSVRSTMELPLNLLVVNLSQTPNWDYAGEVVNGTGFYHRTWKQCKWRYENVVAPREEGKLLLDSTSGSDPGSPSSGKKKKAKAFIKITPPSPSKAARIVKVSQLLNQDNNAQYRQIFCSKFDTIKSIANKRAPTNKPVSGSSQMKSNKHSQMIVDFGINYDNPLPATAIAQSRYDRFQLERKKLEIARQQQQAAVAAASAVNVAANPIPGVSGATIISGAPATVAAISAASAGAPVSSPTKPRGSFSLTGNITPIVIPASSAEMINRDVNIPNIIAQRNRQAELTVQQQQVLLQRQMAQAQAQSLTSLLNQPQAIPPSQVVVSQSQQQVTAGQHVTVLTSGVPTAPTQQQGLRAPTPMQVHQTGTPPTVVLATGLAQALAAPPGSITVSSSGINTSPTTLTTTIASGVSAPNLPAATRPMQTVMSSSTLPSIQQRVSTITMQDLVSSAAGNQRFQSATILTTSAPSVSTIPQQTQTQPTLVSLTPTLIGSGNQQLTTKLLQQNPSGQATLVQSSSPLTPTSTITQQTGGKLSSLQLQYLKQGISMRSASPVITTTQPQQVHQMKDQQQQIITQQIKRIQVVAAPSPPTIVSSTASGTTQPPPPVSLPPISTIQTVSTFSTLPVVSGAPKSSPVVTISSAGTTAKVSLSQPHVTIMQCQSPPTNVIPTPQLIQQQQQRHLQLVKQHTVGGKTVTRQASDAEVAAFFKQHGMSINYPPHTGIPVNPSPAKTSPVATYQGPVSVQGSPALLTVGLQNTIMKVQQAPGGSVAALVKPSPGQAGQTSAGNPVTFPVHVSKVPLPPGTIPNMPASQQLVVQAPQSQMPSTVQLQQFQKVFTQVGGGLLPQAIAPQLLGKPIAVSGSPSTITVTTSGPTTSAALGLPVSASSSTASLVHIPSSMVPQSSNIHARLVPVAQNLPTPRIRQTLQVISTAPTPGTVIGTTVPVRKPGVANIVSAPGTQPVNHALLKSALPPTAQPQPPSDSNQRRRARKQPLVTRQNNAELTFVQAAGSQHHIEITQSVVGYIRHLHIQKKDPPNVVRYYIVDANGKPYQ